MEIVLPSILEFTGRNPRLRRVCSVWKECIDENDKAILDGIYHSYGVDRDVPFQDLFLLVVSRDDILSLEKVHKYVNCFLPVDWTILLPSARAITSIYILFFICPGSYDRMNPYVPPPPGEKIKKGGIIRDVPSISPELEKVLEDDNLAILQELHPLLSRDGIPITSFAIAYGAKRIYDYLRQRYAVSVEHIFCASGEILQEMCRDRKCTSCIFLPRMKNLSPPTSYDILSRILSFESQQRNVQNRSIWGVQSTQDVAEGSNDGYEDLFLFDVLAIVASLGYVSLLDKYLKEGDVIPMVASTYFPPTPSKEVYAVMHQRGYSSKVMQLYISRGTAMGRKEYRDNTAWRPLLTSAFLAGNLPLIEHILSAHRKGMTLSQMKAHMENHRRRYCSYIKYVARIIIDKDVRDEGETLQRLQSITGFMSADKFSGMSPYRQYLLSPLLKYISIRDKYRKYTD